MKLSLNWIKDYVQIPADMDLKNLAYDLTMSTVEVEGVTELARRFDGIVSGDIREVLPHPNADKLRICRVDIGGGELHDIVCGGSNLSRACVSWWRAPAPSCAGTGRASRSRSGTPSCAG